MRVLITDSDCPAGLAIVRSLYRAGFEITAASENKNAVSFFSRCITDHFLYSSPIAYPLRFIEEMVPFTERNRLDVVFPVTDFTTLLFQKCRDEFPPYTRFAMANREGYDNVSNKEKALKTAAANNLPIPETYFLSNINDLRSIANRIRYPVVIKTKFSRYFNSKAKIIQTGKVTFAYSRDDLIRKYEEIHNNIPFPFIQEFIKGTGYGTELLVKNNRVLAKFQHKRIREIRPTGSASSFCESVEVNGAMFKNSVTLLKELNFEGSAMVEYKVDSRDNIPKLMEINGRFWGSLPLAVECGVDFPLLFYKAFFNNENFPRINKYKIGIKGRFLAGDTKHLIAVLKGRPKGWIGDFPGKASTILNYLKFFQKNMIYFDVKLSDPLPGVMAIIMIFKSLVISIIRSFLKPKKI